MVFENEVSHLFDLISLRLVSDGLQVDNLLDFRLVEDDVAATALTARESATFKKMAEIGKSDVRVGTSVEDVRESFPGPFMTRV